MWWAGARRSLDRTKRFLDSSSGMCILALYFLCKWSVSCSAPTMWLFLYYLRIFALPDGLCLGSAPLQISPSSRMRWQVCGSGWSTSLGFGRGMVWCIMSWPCHWMHLELSPCSLLGLQPRSVRLFEEPRRDLHSGCRPIHPLQRGAWRHPCAD